MPRRIELSRRAGRFRRHLRLHRTSDRNEWSDEQILLAYRGQSEVEEAFRQLKDDEHMAVRPQYHWTDQKICVHTFCCRLALLPGRVIEFQARQLHYTQGLSGLLDLLGTVRLVMLLRPAGKQGGRLAASGHWNRASRRQCSCSATSCRHSRPLCIHSRLS